MNPNRLNLTLGVANVLVAAFLVYSFFFAQQRLVYINSAKLLNEYQGMIDARAAYSKKASGWKANIDTLTKEVQGQIFSYEKESSKMTTKERQLSQELIRTKQNQLAQYQQAMNSQAQQEDQKMTGDVITQVNAYLKKYGQSHRYKIILAATDYGNIAYADEGLDITAEVVKGLNEEYKGK